MTGNEILALVKKRIKNTSSTIDWDSLFQIIIDDIFSREQWKFAQRQLNYIHTGNVFEKTFDADPDELALSKIKSIRVVSSLAFPGPIPGTSTARALQYIPLQRFMDLYPEQVEVGEQWCWTELHSGDGSNGKQIGIYMLASDDFSVWIDGDFIPVINIGDSPIPILPKQFHRLVFYGVTMLAAEETGLDKLAIQSERRYEQGISLMQTWNMRMPAYWPVKRPYDSDITTRKGPFFPSNFPFGVGR
jgi:hypothetical protein